MGDDIVDRFGETGYETVVFPFKKFGFSLERNLGRWQQFFEAFLLLRFADENQIDSEHDQRGGKEGQDMYGPITGIVQDSVEKIQ
jgi:hypothetical protein